MEETTKRLFSFARGVQLKENEYVVVCVIDLEVYFHLMQIVKEKLNAWKVIYAIENILL